MEPTQKALRYNSDTQKAIEELGRENRDLTNQVQDLTIKLINKTNEVKRMKLTIDTLMSNTN